MTLTAAQYSQIGQGYEKAAGDPWVGAEKRVDLVNKAEWFRFLALRENQAIREYNTAPASATFEGRVRRSMSPFLTILWVTGAAVYLFGTVLFTNAVNLFGTEEPGTSVPEIRQPVESVPKVVSVEANNGEQAQAQHMVNPERRHAIPPDQPTYKSPSLTAPSSALPQEELASDASSEPVQDVVGVESAEVFIVTTAATIRNGPSTSAKKIGTATAGAELQVKEREKDWVHFVDPSSGNTGWVQASLLKKPAPTSEAKILAVPQTVEPASVKPAKVKLAKAKLAKKQPVPAKATRQPRTYVGLPPDEEFLPPRRRGPGLLSRRRMLRED